MAARNVKHLSYREQLLRRCIHFNGIIINKTCTAGIPYNSFVAIDSLPTRFPCLKWHNSTLMCEKAVFNTEEQVDVIMTEQTRETQKYFAAIAEDRCPNHDIPITLVQIDSCVYAKPCGCRLYQGSIK